MRLLIAKDFPTAVRYLHTMNPFTRGDVVIVTSTHQLMGVERRTKILVHPTFYERPDWRDYHTIMTRFDVCPVGDEAHKG